MGSYGIGLGRLMGVVTEVLGDESGVIWPDEIAPFTVHLISIGKDDQAQELYEKLTAKGVEVLFDDRDTSSGAKFADADLIGIPHRIVISERSLDQGGLEYKKRDREQGEIISVDDFVAKF
jgi:prolyl-tRNA synthetase